MVYLVEQIDVLIVDDHTVLAESLAGALSEHGFGQVRTAASAAASLTAVRERRPDVVLMDFRLPDGDGTKAAASIKAEFPSIKVVMLTAEVHESIVIQAIEAGCSGYLLKNSRLDEVIGAVRSAHAGEALISPMMLARILPKLSSSRGRARFELSKREMEVLSLVAEGLSNQSIAESLVLSTNTVRNHVQRILSKLGVHSKLEAVAVATRQGLIRASGSS